jgi:hypothetical protein
MNRKELSDPLNWSNAGELSTRKIDRKERIVAHIKEMAS